MEGLPPYVIPGNELDICLRDKKGLAYYYCSTISTREGAQQQPGPYCIFLYRLSRRKKAPLQLATVRNKNQSTSLWSPNSYKKEGPSNCKKCKAPRSDCMQASRSLSLNHQLRLIYSRIGPKLHVQARDGSCSSRQLDE